MPKGVEHQWQPYESVSGADVMTAVMPKGVEHYWVKFGITI